MVGQREGMMEFIMNIKAKKTDQQAGPRKQQKDFRWTSREEPMQQDVAHQEGGEAREEGSEFSEKQKSSLSLRWTNA